MEIFVFVFNVFVYFFFFFLRERVRGGVQWVMPNRVIDLLAGRRSWFGKHSSAV